LVALDETTGQIKWSHGPMAVSDGDESLMRFECAPAAGPSTIYANYVLDNIKGDTHIDSEYGIIAFESSTGRVKWRRQVCRLQPGKFDGSFGSVRKNRIRSFFTPPLYHEGTVYVCSNAGAITAMDSLSGRIKWLIRYPYYPSVHDLTRQFGNMPSRTPWLLIVQPHEPMFWLNQRPLVVGEHLYVMPVNSPFMLCLDRKTGKVNWTFDKPTVGFNYFLGPISTGELVITGNGRASPNKLNTFNGNDPCYLVDPNTGKITWKSPDIVMKEDHPVMTTYFFRTPAYFSMNDLYFEIGARPFLSEDDKIIMTSWSDRSTYSRMGMSMYALGEIDLKNKKVLGQRRYYTGATLAHADMIINDKVNRSVASGGLPHGAPLYYEDLSKIPRRTKEEDEQMSAFDKIAKDTVPVNEYPAFQPFSRITFSRYGIPFELRLSPRKISMVYNRSELEAKTSTDNSLISTFGKSEISVKDGDYKKASEYLNQCLLLLSPEDVNIRSLVKQQFYKVYLELVRSAIRSNKPKLQMENTLGMSNTASVLAEEIEALFALSEAYSSGGNFKNAASCLRTLIEVYGNHEFPISALGGKSIFNSEALPKLNETLNEIFTEAKGNLGKIYRTETEKALELASKSIPLFLSSVSPLSKELNVRTGDLAILKLIELLKNSGGYESEYNKLGDTELAGDKIDQLIYHLWKYPGITKGQETFSHICTLSLALPDEDKRNVWRKLGHMAKICKFKLPSDLTDFLAIPQKSVFKDINPSEGDKSYEVGSFKDGIMITLQREGDQSIQPNLLFLGVKLPKKVGFRFSVVCFDLAQGNEVWRKEEFRLKDLGKEPGFYKAYVYKDMVVVNGLYDVFAFNIKDGAEIWHYKAPFSFEIVEATMSGNIFALCGNSETIALQIDTKSPIGEVAWQQKEDGNIYYKPYFVNDLFISIRKYPFNLTSRHRTTGSLTARMSLPDLSQVETHPLLKEESLALPIAQYDRFVTVTDEKYIIVYDVVKMVVLWKTLLSNVDISKEVQLRIEMNDKYVVVVKEDFDRKAIYCFNLNTGEILWNTDPVYPNSPQPLSSLLLDSDTLYGIGEYAGMGFYFVSYDCAKGATKFKKMFEGYGVKPKVDLRQNIYGKHIVAEIQEKKDFQLMVFDKNTGEVVKKVSEKGDGPIGEVGRVAMTIQDGHPILFSKLKFKY
jgi:outer membrane protein assembly factor BamB/tetratricopeptide (TPR) repeat protein